MPRPWGDVEASHEHRIATEVTLLLHGEAEMCGRRLRAGDILVLEPGTATDFRAITACTTVVVKTPSVMGDKHPAPPAYACTSPSTCPSPSSGAES